jgi:hypothetical protein
MEVSIDEKIILFFFSLLILLTQTVKANVSNSSEIRAVYFHRICSVSSGYDWDPMTSIMESYKFNLCLLPTGISEYNTSWWNSHKACLSEAVTACHNNGMEAHILFAVLGSWGYNSYQI